MSAAAVHRLAIIGCGLIGSSVARAARAKGAADEIVICDISEAVRARVVELAMADQVVADPAEAARGADLVILAVPPAMIGVAAMAAAPGLEAGAILSDVGSVKGAVGEAMAAAAPPGVAVVPGHPIAGTEQSGPAAGFASLFENRWTILCPRVSDDPAYPAAVEKLSAFWRTLGAQVELMDDRHHDLVLAVTSHLPHLIAYNIVGTADDLEGVTQGEVMKFSAGGFRDFTRIAASDPVMWRDVFILNKDAVLEILGRFTRAIRRGIVAAGQESPEPNFGRDKKPTS